MNYNTKKSVSRIYRTIRNPIVVLLLANPGKLAYNWYQYRKAQGNKIAVENSFHDVINSNSEVFSVLRDECLKAGGRNSEMIYLWSSDIIIFDEHFDEDPGLVLNSFVKKVNMVKNSGLRRVGRQDEPSQENENRVVDLINFRGSWLAEPFNWNEVLKIEEKHSKFCVSEEFARQNEIKKRCPGSEMDDYRLLEPAITEYLKEFYKSENLWLKNCLENVYLTFRKRLLFKYDLPNWLKEATK